MPEDWVRLMYCVKHLMKLHPEYNEMIMPFYTRLYEQHPYDENNPLEFETKHLPLDEMIWELGLTLPSWDDEDNTGENDER